MGKTSPNPSWLSCAQSGWLLRVWASILVVAGAVVTTLLFWSHAPTPERAYLRGMRYLVAGDKAAAAEQFESAISEDPRFEGAWHGLIEAAPTLTNCHRCAQHLPGLFDSQQPIRDEAALFRDPTRDSERRERLLELYEKAIRAAAEGARDPSPLLLDYDGRRELSRAWSEVEAIRAELQANIREPLIGSPWRAFATYDLPAIRRVVQDSLNQFSNPQHWGKLLERIDGAAAMEASGLAKLEAAVKRAPAFVPAQLTLALVEIARGRPGDAADRCRKLLEVEPAHGVIPGELHLRYCLARALELAADYAGGALELEQVLTKKPGHAQTMLRLGALYLKLGRSDDAAVLADALVKGSEQDRRADYIRGVVNLWRGQYETAAAQLGGVLQYFPGSEEVRYYLALALRGAGKHLSALREFAAVADAGFGSAWPLAAAAMSALAAARGEVADQMAAALLNRADALRAPARLRSYMLRVRLAAAAFAGRRDDVGRFIHELAQVASDDSDRELHDALVAGIVASQTYVAAESDIQMPEQHLEFFRSAVPNRPSAQYALAFLLTAAGRVSEARTTLEQLLAIWPKHELAVLHLSRLWVLDGKTELGARVLEQSGLADTSPDVQRALRLIHTLQGIRVALFAEPRAERPPESSILGPHLAFFALVVDDDHRAFARLMLLLNPASEATHEILRLVYPRIRLGGLAGLAEAARESSNIDAALRRIVAAYSAASADGNGLYRLTTGRFWNEMPRHL